MKFLTLLLFIALAVPVLADPGTRHENQRGKGHANHQGNGWGHHEKPPKPPCETEQCEPRPPHRHVHKHVHNHRNTNTNCNVNTNTNTNRNVNTNTNTNRNTNTNTNRNTQSQSQNVANNIDIAFGDIGSSGTMGSSGTLAGGWGYARDIWRQVYQATPWQPAVAPIQPVYQYQQQRPLAKTYLAAPSYMHNGKRYVIME